MSPDEKKLHWEKIYNTKQPNEVSWYEEKPIISLDLISELNLPKSARIMDNGGGDSHLVDYLLNLGFENITVRDISVTALNRAKHRLGKEAKKINWLVQEEANDVSSGQYDLWHDRAAFHFLTLDKEINHYVNNLANHIKPGGHLILATFSEQGPAKCSGLDVSRYSESSLTHLLKDSFTKEKCFTIDHTTPGNTIQNFLYCCFRRINPEVMENQTPYS